MNVNVLQWERNEKKNRMVDYFMSCLQKSKIQQEEEQTIKSSSSSSKKQLLKHSKSPLVRRLERENQKLMKSESVIVKQFEKQQQKQYEFRKLSSSSVVMKRIQHHGRNNNNNNNPNNNSDQQKIFYSYSHQLSKLKWSEEDNVLQQQHATRIEEYSILSQSFFAHRPCDYSHHCKLPIRCVFDLQHEQYHRLFVVLIDTV